MFERLGDTVVARRRLVLTVTVLLVAAAGIAGAGVASKLTSGGFEDEGSESFRAMEALERDFGVTDPNLILLVTARGESVDDRAAATEGVALTEELASEDGVGEVVSYWTTGASNLKSRDSTQALVLGVIEGDDDVAGERVGTVSEEYTRSGEALEVEVGGFQEVFRVVGEEVESDLVRAESIALPITLILLVLVFGSLVAASLPLVIGGIAILGSFLTLTVLAELTDVSIFALNLITMLGLGLGIDYSLFIVSRYREELRGGAQPHDAVRRTVATAGRTVAFSGLTVALSLSALLIFPLPFLRSFAYAGVAVVVLAGVAAVVFLPALLAVLGRRVDSLSIRRRRAERADDEGFWHRMAMIVMRRPIPVATAVVVVLVLLGAPFAGVEWGQTDHRVLPEETRVRRVTQQISTNFAVDNNESLSVIARVSPGDPDVAHYAAKLSGIRDVAAVESAAGSFSNGDRVAPPGPQSRRYEGEDETWMAVALEGGSSQRVAERAVISIRATEAGFATLAGGSAARSLDSRESLFSRFPVAGLIIGAATFVLLFFMFGSILVPIKAIVLNLLSLTATYGAVVWIFQEGNLSGLLDFAPTGSVDVTMPILMFCIAFGLSMDYEVFLLSRIKEEHDRTGDNVASVALGLERTGKIVTAAALLLSVVFVAFATSGVTFIKLFGVGLTIAVLADATLVRATLVPAFMRLAGEANWWAPRGLRRLYDRFGISEAKPEAVRRGSHIDVATDSGRAGR